MRQAVRYVLYALLWGLVLALGAVAKVWLHLMKIVGKDTV